MTRKCFAILFLSIYAVVLFRPLFPIIEYAMNKEYIMKNLCENRGKPKSHCNGKCHLMKQIKKQGSGIDIPYEDNGQKKNNAQVENLVHINNTIAYAMSGLADSDPGSCVEDRSFFRDGCISGIFHPPCKA